MDALGWFGRLKRIPRTGWLTAGLGKAQVESVADHTARTAFLTMLVCDSMKSDGLDVERALKMAIIHDLPEAALMDLDRPGSQAMGRERKGALELTTLKKILSSVPAKARVEYERCFKEYLDGLTMEARVVRVADKAETYIQAKEYEEMGFPNRLGSQMRKELRQLINAYRFRRTASSAGIRA